MAGCGVDDNEAAAATEALFRQTPLCALGDPALETLSDAMNPRKHLAGPDGRLRDWSGLADVAGLTPLERRSVGSAIDHTRRLIAVWGSRAGVTVATLVDALESVGRFDAVDDALPFILADCAASNANAAPLQRRHPVLGNDAQEQRGTYDAMVLYAREDTAFALHFVDRCESAGLRILLPERDLAVGTLELEASSRMIERSCRKVVAILSPSFVDSGKNMFLTSFSQHVGVVDGGDDNDKIIPVILRPCKMPAVLTMYHKVVYDPTSRFNFWTKVFSVTFGVKDLPDRLKTYEFFLDERLDSKRSADELTPPLRRRRADDTLSVDTATTDLSVTLSLELPDVPNEEPGQPLPRTGLKKLGNIFSRKDKRKKAVATK